MSSRRQGIAIGLALTLLASVGVVGAPEADAYCVQLSTADQINPSWGREHTPNTNTCDGDAVYNGKVTDKLTDGSCVWVQFKEGSTIYTQATSCNSSGINYTFWDQNGNNWSGIRICRDHGCNPTGGLFWNTQDY